MSTRPIKLTTLALTPRQAASLKRVITYTIDAEMKHYLEDGSSKAHIYRDAKMAALALGLYTAQDLRRRERRWG